MIKVTPDLLRFDDGRPVDAASWQERRGELHRAIVPHEYGGMFPSGQATEAVLRARSGVQSMPGCVNATYTVRTTFASGAELCFTLTLLIPPGKGPFPVVLEGDGCWRYFDDEVAARVVARGNIAARFDRTEAAADNKDLYRETGLYCIFPESRIGVLPAWAWAYHRAVDALLTMPEVRSDAIAITGHSRGGKTVLLAGATDQRIALTNPNGSGIGGAGLNRLKAAGSETVDAFFSGNIFWFGDGFKAHRNRDAELPYDQHYLHALVAPRLLLVTDAYEDHPANPPGTYAACLAAREVWKLLGAPQNIGWVIREGQHAHTLADFEALLDFMDMHLHQREAPRQFQRRLFPDLGELLHGA